uniref:nucleoside-diphosphate kinase n=1 Tax=Cyprinus carpio TaxID=7962 RepID=A0A8C1SAI3_CYPCA
MFERSSLATPPEAGLYMSAAPGAPSSHFRPQDPPVLRLTRECVTMAAKTERTFIAVKPDGVQRGLIGEIVKRFEQKGFRLVAMKFLQASEDLLKQHYIDLKDRPFYPGLVKYMSSGPVAAMVWEGLNVVKTGRVMLGETNPADSKPGTIRGDFCIEVGSSERADETQRVRLLLSEVDAAVWERRRLTVLGGTCTEILRQTLLGYF